MTTAAEVLGFILALVGAGAIESECVWIPLAMMGVGAAAMALGVHFEGRR